MSITEQASPESQNLQVTSQVEAAVSAKAEERKFSEVVSLMTKYDDAEKKAKWLNSDEYA